jgi:hypothetical protein
MGFMGGFEGNIYRPRGGAVGCDIALQPRRSRVRFPRVSLKFFLMSLSFRTQPKWAPRIFYRGKGGRFSGNLGASTS